MRPSTPPTDAPFDPGGDGRAELFAAAFNSLNVHAVILDGEGRIAAVNNAWNDFASNNGIDVSASPFEGVDYLAQSSGTLDPGDDTPTQGVRAVLAGEVTEFRAEYPCHSPTELRWFELRATPLSDDGAAGAVVVHSNITARKLAEQQLEYLANHDELTGLANRRQMMATLSDARRSDGLGVMLVDLDRFKAVNDTYGHAAGNEVLRCVAEAIGRPLGRGSLAARHGGDEYCVALFDCDEAVLRAAGPELCRRTRTHLEALPWASGVSVSVGGALARPGEPIAAVLQRADEALYVVKGQGRDGFNVS